MTGDIAPVHTVPPAVALPAPRRPGPPAVWTSVSSGSPDRGSEEAATEQQPQVRDPAGAAPVSALNRRDLEVLSCLARGRSTAQIASSLSVSRNTARTRIRRVQSKLDVAGRDAAVRAAQDLGVLAILPRRSAFG
jgi:DNA-binding CsgD family transcriptional regulator